jgi:flavodoxin
MERLFERGVQLMKCLLVVFSYHHKNTEKVAKAMAEVLGTSVQTPNQVSPDDLRQVDLIGLGSGIYSAKHHQTVLDLADALAPVADGKAFIFSTTGAPKIAITDKFVASNHSLLREKLQTKGYEIVGEFSCAGFNTNSFLHWFGGLNKGRPNADDLEHAREFARILEQKLQDG